MLETMISNPLEYPPELRYPPPLGIFSCRFHHMKRRLSPKLLAGFLVLAATGMLARNSTSAAAQKLDATLPSTGSVQPDFRIATDGTSVVYRSDRDQDEKYELYRVAITGGYPIKLSGPLSSAGDVSTWQMNADGTRAIYWANVQGDDLVEVLSTPIVGGEATKLNPPLVGKGSTIGSQASNRVVYIASERRTVFNIPYFELFSAPTAGGEAKRLNDILANGGNVQAVFAQPASDRVIYLADQDSDDVVELYGVSAAGGPSTKLNPPLVANGSVLPDGLQLSPSGDRALFAADQEEDSRVEVFVVPALGGSAVKLNGALVEGGSVTAGSQRFGANGARVLYRADQNIDEVFEIFSVASTGGLAVPLNGPLVTNGDVRSEGLQFSPDSSHVLYTADQDEDEVYELFSVPTSGGLAVKLNGDLVNGGDVMDDAVFSPTGGRVLYRADQDVDDVVELYSSPGAGGNSIRLNDDLVIGGNVERASFSPDGKQVAYLADQDVDDVFELYYAPSDGSGIARKISGTMVPGGSVTDWQFSPDGRTIVYRANQELVDHVELFAATLSESLPGDFDGSGIVDAADYAVWRNGLATNAYSPGQYGVWKANFGRRLGDGAAAMSAIPRAIPEPTAIMLMVGAAVLLSQIVSRRTCVRR